MTLIVIKASSRQHRFCDALMNKIVGLKGLPNKEKPFF